VTVPSAADSAGSETIRRLTAQYERGMNAGNVDTIVDAYYGDEYYVLNGPVARIDRRAWSDYLHTLVRQNWLEVRVVPDLIHVEGALGVVWGHYSTRFARRGAGGDTTTVYQRYVEVWRREADGRWKVWWGLNAPDPSAPR
jgi:ketosteroid isomerase-like protein